MTGSGSIYGGPLIVGGAISPGFTPGIPRGGIGAPGYVQLATGAMTMEIRRRAHDPIRPPADHGTGDSRRIARDSAPAGFRSRSRGRLPVDYLHLALRHVLHGHLLWPTGRRPVHDRLQPHVGGPAREPDHDRRATAGESAARVVAGGTLRGLVERGIRAGAARGFARGVAAVQRDRPVSWALCSMASTTPACSRCDSATSTRSSPAVSTSDACACRRARESRYERRRSRS